MRMKSAKTNSIFKDGRIIDEYSAPIVGTDKKFYGRVWYFRDITKRRRAEEMLRENEELLRAITGNADVVIFLKGIDGRYLFLNAQYEKLFHVTDAAIRGKTDHDIFPKEMADAFRKNGREGDSIRTAPEDGGACAAG